MLITFVVVALSLSAITYGVDQKKEYKIGDMNCTCNEGDCIQTCSQCCNTATKNHAKRWLSCYCGCIGTDKCNCCSDGKVDEHDCYQNEC